MAFLYQKNVVSDLKKPVPKILEPLYNYSKEEELINKC